MEQIDSSKTNEDGEQVESDVDGGSSSVEDTVDGPVFSRLLCGASCADQDEPPVKDRSGSSPDEDEDDFFDRKINNEALKTVRGSSSDILSSRNNSSTRLNSRNNSSTGLSRSGLDISDSVNSLTGNQSQKNQQGDSDHDNINHESISLGFEISSHAGSRNQTIHSSQVESSDENLESPTCCKNKVLGYIVTFLRKSCFPLFGLCLYFLDIITDVKLALTYWSESKSC